MALTMDNNVHRTHTHQRGPNKHGGGCGTCATPATTAADYVPHGDTCNCGRCSPPQDHPLAPPLDACNPPVLFSDALEYSYGPRGFRANVTADEWKSLQNRLSSQDYVDEVFLTGVGAAASVTANLGNVASGLPAGDRFFALGFGVTLTYNANVNMDPIRLSCAFTDPESAARTSTAIKVQPKAYVARGTFICHYMQGSRMVPSIAQLVGHATTPTTLDVTLNPVPTNVGYEVYAISDSRLAAMRGQAI